MALSLKYIAETYSRFMKEYEKDAQRKQGWAHKKGCEMRKASSREMALTLPTVGRRWPAFHFLM